MRYRVYRKNITLNGVNRLSKQSVLKDLQPVYVNIMRYIPEAEYVRLTYGMDTVKYILVIDRDNRIQSIKLVVDGTDPLDNPIHNEKEIPIPNLCYFNGIADGDVALPDDIKFRTYTASGQQINMTFTGIGGSITDSGTEYSCSFITRVAETPLEFVQVLRTQTSKMFLARLPGSFAYEELEFDVSLSIYEDLPVIPVTQFE